PINHLIGRELVKRRFREALTIFLSHPSDYDSEERRIFRELCKESDYRRALSMLKPEKPELDLEVLVLRRLVKDPNRCIEALRELPLTLRRLFINAYQSYICNRVLSSAVNAEMDLMKVEEGDYCGEFDLIQGRLIKVSRYFTSTSPSNPIHKGSDILTISIPLIPIVGYTYRTTKNRFDVFIDQVLEEEGVKARDFYIKELPEVSVEGGFRVAPLLCKAFDWNFDQNGISLTMELFKGSYATVILREIIKPRNPVEAGF
ncbi:MAG: tRNA pseudouridine(13) synthase TruD, partial [Nitrososphaerales archaeon]|nr:tRNA pseudouridine(13) synthase TruD [Nitrososphaerales archaeon]